MSHEHTDGILSLDSEPREHLDCGLGISQLDLGLVDVHLGYDAGIEPGLENADRILPRDDGLLGDLQPGIEVAEEEIETGEIRYQCQSNGTIGLFGGHQFLHRSFVGPADATPQVYLPEHVRRQEGIADRNLCAVAVEDFRHVSATDQVDPRI